MKRTIKQNKSLHQYFDEVSRELNNQGVDVKVLVANLRVDTTPEMIKGIYRAIGQEQYGIKSTTELTTIQLQGCWEEFNKMLSNQDIFVPFPSVENSEEYLASYNV